jgi:hypothetical protein
MMVLQNCTNSEKVLVGPYGETYPASYDANQAMNIKAEEADPFIIICGVGLSP